LQQSLTGGDAASSAVFMLRTSVISQLSAVSKNIHLNIEEWRQAAAKTKAFALGQKIEAA
jgi:hypothetical protein